MFDHTREAQESEHDEPTAEVTGAGPASAEPATAKIRLAQLAAQAAAEQGGQGAARHATQGATGRLVRRWLPEGFAGVPGLSPRRMAIVAALVGVAAIGAITALLLAGRPEPERPPPLPVAHEGPSSRAPQSPPTSDAAEESGEPLVVSVVGKVAKPGLLTLPPGSRVADAIREAGGARPEADLLTVNLARRLSDGEQLYVGVPAPPGMRIAQRQPAPAAAGDATAESKVDLNAADQEQLEGLPGVGEVTARRIIEWREKNGHFTAVEQLREVDGIGEKRFADLSGKVTVG